MWLTIVMIIIVIVVFKCQSEKEDAIRKKDEELSKIRKESQAKFHREMEERYNDFNKFLYNQTEHCLKINPELSKYETTYIVELLNKYRINTSISYFDINSITYENIYKSIKCVLICEEHMHLMKKIILEENIQLPDDTIYDTFRVRCPFESTAKEDILPQILDYIDERVKYKKVKDLKDRLDNLYYQNVYQSTFDSKYKYPEFISDSMMDHLLKHYLLSSLTSMSDDQLIEIMKDEFDHFYSHWNGY